MSPWRDWLPFGKVPELSAEQLAERLNEVQLLDVRTDRKSTRLNSSHDQISYAVFCLKKKKQNKLKPETNTRHTHVNEQTL